MEQITTMKETKISIPRINHDYRKNIRKKIEEHTKENKK
jgi:hypothetical protein